MSIEEFCRTEVITIEKSASVTEAAQHMRQNHVGCLIVTEIVSGEPAPIGILTDRDITLELVAEALSGNDVTVADVMVRHPVTIKRTEGLYDTVRAMEQNGVKRMPVVDEKGRLFGIVTSDDLVSVLSRELNSLANVNNKQVQREREERSYRKRPSAS